MLLEPKKNSRHRVHVEERYIAALKVAMPQSWLEELNTFPRTQEAVDAWATSHGVNAPCVLRFFGTFAGGGYSVYGSMLLSSSSHTPPRPPQEWIELIRDMNRRPLDPLAPRGFIADDYMFSLAIQPAIDGAVVDKDKKKRFEAAISRRVGPLACDPSAEDREAFLQRASDHWHARAHIARSAFGLTVAPDENRWPNTDRDIEWLVRQQVHGHSIADIANRGAADEVDPKMVEQALGRLSRVLQLRRVRGRRRRS